MELEVDKKEFERIQQELIQATVENITLEYFEYEGKKWLNEDFVIPTSVIQKRMKKYEKMIEENPYDKPIIEIHLRELQEILEEGRR